ncbi:MAG: metallophosphoesterase [Candidatus Nanoarchaeia archaeon]|nr:metallophosphoesterase [Candidatus Haiyanarchaeum thermophilum]MCW1303421.1 metallophosphoesterase [Candidatus Haiyanarchaeum thermophilum]MCW1303892.1 metallophosphoesterase [Candidatus Haiyanarchaeum thermophilum]MCW1306877.1 metallophosphoesterase [Candidatus Haiyanarchaeum thermophilum]MCW1307447.1 metallophosphoesterase [Candidatus Haiyanarchaeum thermophilum]
MFKLLKNFEAIRLDEFLIVADLHLGFEVELRKQGYYMLNQTSRLLEKIFKCAGRARKLIINGDLKHSIFLSSKEKVEIPKFISELCMRFEEVVLILGNHDGLLRNLIKPRPRNFRITKSLLHGNFLIFHGHAWPPRRYLKLAEIAIMAHVHPVVELGKFNFRKCWVIGGIDKEAISRKLGFKCNLSKVVIMPCFNDYFAGSKTLISPLSPFISEEKCFLLDLTQVR